MFSRTSSTALTASVVARVKISASQAAFKMPYSANCLASPSRAMLGIGRKMPRLRALTLVLRLSSFHVKICAGGNEMVTVVPLT